MIVAFFSHAFKNFIRSSSFGKEISVQLALGLIALVVLGYSLAFGFALERIIVSDLQQSEPIVFLNGLLIYYFVSEFLTRYFIQSLPVLNIQPYLHLPIARSTIVNFLLGRSAVHVANIFVFLLFTPFALTVVANAYGMSKAWAWLLSIWLFSMTIHFILVLVRKSLDHNAWGLIMLIAVFGGFGAADYYGWLSLAAVSATIFGSVLERSDNLVIFFLLPVFAYIIAFRFFIKKLYPDEMGAQDSQRFRSAEWSFLRSFGAIGTWIRIELKLIARHKRTRAVFFIGVPFFCSLLIIYSRIYNNPNAYAGLLGLGIMATGMIAINYGQFLFSWQAGHFDFSLTQPVPLRILVESKYWLLAAITGFWFLLSIPLLYFGWALVLANFVAFLYNVGINIFLIMNMSMWGPRRIDLEANGTWNYEGMGAAQWLMSIPFLFSPYIFYLPFSIAGHPMLGLLAVGLAGLTGIVLRNKLLDITTRRLSGMRHVMASNFKKDQN